MEPIELNYVPPPPRQNRGELPSHYHNPPPLPEDAADWIACSGQMHHIPSQQPPPPPDQSKWQPPFNCGNVTNWNEHYGQMYPNPPQQPPHSYYPYPPAQHLPSRLPRNAAVYNRTSVVDGNNNKISIGGNLSNNSNDVHLQVFPAIVSVTIVPFLSKEHLLFAMHASDLDVRASNDALIITILLI